MFFILLNVKQSIFATDLASDSSIAERNEARIHERDKRLDDNFKSALSILSYKHCETEFDQSIKDIMLEQLSKSWIESRSFGYDERRDVLKYIVKSIDVFCSQANYIRDAAQKEIFLRNCFLLVNRTIYEAKEDQEKRSQQQVLQ